MLYVVISRGCSLSSCISCVGVMTDVIKYRQELPALRQLTALNSLLKLNDVSGGEVLALAVLEVVASVHRLSSARYHAAHMAATDDRHNPTRTFRILERRLAVNIIPGVSYSLNLLHASWA